MSQSLTDRLYNLLPVLYHQRDLENGQPLRALLAVLEHEFQAIEADTAATYNNWFIQTCDMWVVPYIADLVGIRDMSQAKFLLATQRRQVANTIAYRRRKGTLPVLEHVLRDATGWLVRAIEMSKSAAGTPHLRYAHPDASGTIDLRSAASLAFLQGPSNHVTYTIDLHNNAAKLNQIGLYFWRLRSYLMKNSPAHGIGKAETAHRIHHTFDPLGRDLPLFNYTQFISAISQRTEDIHMPLRLTREMLAIDLQDTAAKYQDRPADEQPRNSAYYGPDRGLNVSVPDITNDNKPTFRNVLPNAVISMDLSEWPDVDVLKAHGPDKEVAIDANLGRFVLLKPLKHPGDIKVNYCYGLSDEIGGGPYRRTVPLTDAQKAGFQCNVAKGTTIHTLEQALNRWEEYCLENLTPSGVIRILDNGVYGGNIAVRLPAGAELAIIADNGTRAAIRPIGSVNVIASSLETIRDEVNERREAGHRSSTDERTGDYAAQSEVTAVAVPDRQTVSQATTTDRHFLLGGLLVSGGLQISAEEQSLATGKFIVRIGHCTLMLNGLKATIADNAQALKIDLDHCIVGPVYAPTTIGGLTVTDSIIDHAGRGGGYAIAGTSKGAIGPAVDLQRVTIFGQVKAAKVTACDVIFTQRVIAPQPATLDQQVKFSYVPEESTTPTGEPYRPMAKTIAPPVFTSMQYGDPAYAQLSDTCPLEIRGGASDGSEMGAFHELHSLEAEANIPIILQEYLPAELEASITYMT